MKENKEEIKKEILTEIEKLEHGRFELGLEIDKLNLKLSELHQKLLKINEEEE